MKCVSLNLCREAPDEGSGGHFPFPEFPYHIYP